ncbi:MULTISPECIES: DUF3307 domain-containing protein [Thioclava]|uniref:DUF3307 domain-containing protein n=1 Tax=Thioclava TaxID=285107 RepID=UPI000C4CA10E|nr:MULTISPECIES: DUF3307 domain-containing protein [Thioclava]MAQ38994.1 hypothetical protein [Thioclava sp.]|tara:strand:- start:185 stop:928 length:744 start_codon:yes stop_codon:yes gene_type:complete
MIETFAALLFAHAFTDFAFQSSDMAAKKAGRELAALATHIAILAGLTLLVGLQLSWALIGVLALVALSHLVIDIAKSFAPREQALAAFLGDQAAHLAATALIAAAFPTFWANSLWANLSWLPGALTLATGLLITTRAGGFAVGMLMAQYENDAPPEGLPQGGRMIGLLERGLIFLLVLAGQPSGIGFLIAAKSILRFEAVSKDGANPKSEYVIIGTLASFGWALAASYATLALLGQLPPLGILPVPD